MTEPVHPAAKVLFRVPDGEGAADVETLWAVDLGDDRYRLDNSPFDAYSVSWQDVVLAPFSPDEQMATFERVLEKSGNRTVRVILDSPPEEGSTSAEVIQGLLRLGCSYEGATERYLSVNIPPGVELEEVRAYLEEREVEWEHADPRYSELYPDEG
jgi:hypothetical protein